MQLATIPKVSILIAAYNAEPFIDECIQSALDQTYKNKEIILINDGSTDNTQKIANKYPIKVIDQKHYGQSFSKNQLFLLSSGDWIQYLDADDYLAKNKIESQINIYLSVKNIKANLKGYPVLVDNYFNVKDGSIYKSHPQYWSFIDNLSQDIRHQPNSCLFSRGALLIIYEKYKGIFPANSSISSNIYLRLMNLFDNSNNPKCHFFYTNQYNSYYRRHDNQQNNILDDITKKNLLECKENPLIIAANLWYCLNSFENDFDFKDVLSFFLKEKTRRTLFQDRQLTSQQIKYHIKLNDKSTIRIFS